MNALIVSRDGFRQAAARLHRLAILMLYQYNNLDQACMFSYKSDWATRCADQLDKLIHE